MNKTEVVKQLKACGSAQTRKTYARHGVTGDQYGVSYAELNKLTKKIKVDQKLAEGLWATGNHDARVLATMIADPSRMTTAKLGAWVRELDNHVLSDAVAKLAAQSPTGEACLRKWIAARREYTACTGWCILAHLSLDNGAPPDDYLEECLDTIESDIHTSANRIRHAMNAALIAIGLRSPALKRKAIAAAKRIGPVEVDHGDTSCKTPDAVAYIQKAAAHRRKKTAPTC